MLMHRQFPLLGAAHLLTIAAIPALAAVLAWIGRKSAAASNRVRIGLGLVLLVDELAWYIDVFHAQGLPFPDGLPLQLSDFLVWSTVIAALTRKRIFFEFSYFAGISASGMAVLTPDLWAQPLSYDLVQFFVSHGLIIITVLAMLWMHAARITRGSMWRAFAILNALALALGIFDWRFGANYMYLRAKPEAASLLDYLGPWPAYLFFADFVALGLFFVLALPFRRVSGTRDWELGSR